MTATQDIEFANDQRSGHSLQRVVGRLDVTPRRCWVTRTTDGCEYIAEFDDNQTAAIRHTVKYPDGREYSW